MARKELLHIVRDTRSLTLALALPVLMLVMFGFALSLDVDRIRTTIHDADQTPVSRDLVEQFRASRFFAMQADAGSQKELEERIEAGKTMLAISVPRGFGRDIQSRREAEVQILLDGSDSNTASIALGYAETTVRGYSMRLQGATPPIDVRLRVMYNSSMQSKNYIVPGLIAVIVMIIAALLTSMTIAREWEMGTMEQLLSTPVRAAEIVLGKMSAYFCVGVVATVISIVTGLTLFNVPFRGNVIVLAVSIGVFLCGALFWGTFISAVAKNQLLAFQMGMMSSFLPAFLLSGFVYAIESMPRAMQLLTVVIPARHFVTILKGIFLKGIGFEVLWFELLFLTLFALVIFRAATRRLSEGIA
jgi:ABC-2 type transport system permease protein